MRAKEALVNVGHYRYDPATGFIVSTRYGRKVGHLRKSDGYIQVEIYGRVKIPAHRLAWRLHYGRWPADSLDHINGVTTDNRIANLREATSAENSTSRTFPIGMTGARNVWRDRVGRYRVAVQANGRDMRWKASHFISACVAAPLIRRALHGDFAIDKREAAGIGALTPIDNRQAA